MRRKYPNDKTQLKCLLESLTEAETDRASDRVASVLLFLVPLCLLSTTCWRGQVSKSQLQSQSPSRSRSRSCSRRSVVLICATSYICTYVVPVYDSHMRPKVCALAKDNCHTDFGCLLCRIVALTARSIGALLFIVPSAIDLNTYNSYSFVLHLSEQNLNENDRKFAPTNRKTDLLSPLGR